MNFDRNSISLSGPTTRGEVSQASWLAVRSTTFTSFHSFVLRSPAVTLLALSGPTRADGPRGETRPHSAATFARSLHLMAVFRVARNVVATSFTCTMDASAGTAALLHLIPAVGSTDFLDISVSRVSIAG